MSTDIETIANTLTVAQKRALTDCWYRSPAPSSRTWSQFWHDRITGHRRTQDALLGLGLAQQQRDFDGAHGLFMSEHGRAVAEHLTGLSVEARALFSRAPGHDGVIWLDPDPPFSDNPAAQELWLASLVDLDLDTFAMTIKRGV